MENNNNGRIIDAQPKVVDGDVVVEIKYENGKVEYEPYSEERLQAIKQEMIAQEMLDKAKEKRKAIENGKQLPAVKENTEVAVIEEKEEEKDSVLPYVLAGAGIVLVGSLIGYAAFKNLSSKDTNTQPTTIETNTETTNTNDINIEGIQIVKEKTYEEAVSDITDITKELEKAGYLDSSRELQVTQEMINNTYFVINSSEMSVETQSALVNNGIISSDMDEAQTYLRNMLEVAAIEDNHYAKGDGVKRFELLRLFFKSEDALKMYDLYVDALDTVKGMAGLSKEEKEQAISLMYNDISTYAIDNNTKTFGNPKSVGAGAHYVFNVLIRKNILATMVEMGYLNQQQYEAITGKHTEIINGVETEVLNTEIMKNNDLWDLLSRVCRTNDASVGGLSSEEVAALRAEYANSQAPTEDERHAAMMHHRM